MIYLYGTIIYILAGLGIYFVYLCWVYRRIDKRIEEIKFLKEEEMNRKILTLCMLYEILVREGLQEEKIKRTKSKKK